jgi:hypothetical protein
MTAWRRRSGCGYRRDPPDNEYDASSPGSDGPQETHDTFFIVYDDPRSQCRCAEASSDHFKFRDDLVHVGSFGWIDLHHLCDQGRDELQTLVCGEIRSTLRALLGDEQKISM